MRDSIPKLLWILVGGLVLLNLFQANFTELLYDEAYYWYYARDLDWGYFDHPPMVALMIWVSELFAGGELGVRLVSCLFSGSLLLLLWKMVDHPDKSKYAGHFFVLLFSMTLINAYGFFTLPDTPLLFFTTLFLLLYKNYVEKATWGLALGLGVVMACLLYSKYHGVLVILFVFLSNPRLALQPKAWGAVVIGLLCYLPHLLWLYEMDFISLKYHLFERPNRAYEFGDFTLGYFINLVALFGLTFPWVYKALWKAERKDTFTRALKFLAYGVLLFFFVSSFQRRVQTQWIILICIPMAVLTFRQLIMVEADRRWLMRTAIANGVILLILRLGLVYEPLFPIVFETHGNERWVSSIADQVGDTPVVFENSYRRAPMYAFYSGHTSFSLNNVFYRKNQYDIDNSEEAIRGKRVLYIAKRFRTGDISYKNAKGDTFHGVFLDDFNSYRKLSVSFPELGRATFLVHNPYEREITIEKLQFGIAFLNAYKQVQEVELLDVKALDGASRIPPGGEAAFQFEFPEIPVADNGHFKIVISENSLFHGLNGESIKLEAWKP